MYRAYLAAIALFAPLTVACTDAALEDEFLTDDIVEASDDSKADLGAMSTYYQVKPDFRRCAAPRCGGVYYNLINASTTQCFDGRRAATCYAASVDWARLGLNEGGIDAAKGSLYQGDLIVRASVGRKNWGGSLGSFGELRPSEAWDGKGPNQPSGVFTKVELTGVRCITTPCPLFREGLINGTGTANLAELGWDESDATQEQIDAANADMLANKLIIAGSRYTATGPGGRMAARTVTNFYQRVTSVEVPVISVATRDWNAWINAKPGGPRSFHVSGVVDLPSPGYSATLQPASPQGINPTELILELTVRAPSGGIWPQVITPVDVRFDQTPLVTNYQTVLVRVPGGATVPLTVFTAL
jgi:hypothetical protein